MEPARPVGSRVRAVQAADPHLDLHRPYGQLAPIRIQRPFVADADRSRIVGVKRPGRAESLLQEWLAWINTTVRAAAPRVQISR